MKTDSFRSISRVIALSAGVITSLNADPIQGPGGHYYEVVPAPGITWDAANAAAQSSSYLGLQGHLVTITSAGEAAAVGSMVANAGLGEVWAGGYQDPITETDSRAGWTWVNGEGTIPGVDSTTPYAHWWGSWEPNDNYGPGSEQYLGFNLNGLAAFNDEGSLSFITGYVVEFDANGGGGPSGPTYDITADFSATQNPNGVWSYGWSESRGSTFQFDTPGEDLRYGHIVGWVAPNFESAAVPIAFAVTDWNQGSNFIPAGEVEFHPGPVGQNSVIRWTAPASGRYQIEGWFTGDDFVCPTSTDVAVLHGTTELFIGAINSYRVPLNFSLIEQVTAGETIDFTVGYGADGSYYCDSTGVNATIRALNEDHLLPGDLNSDDCVDRTDLSILMAQIRARQTNLAFDLNGDGKVDIADARFLALHFTNPGGAPCPP